MELTDNELIEIVKFYKEIGIPEDVYLAKDGILNLFSILNIEPNTDAYGTRVFSPYEILGVPPKIIDGVEKPIVFAIKHKVDKIAKIHFDSDEFLYKGSSVNKKDDLLETLKTQYSNAVNEGNLREANEIFEMIDKMTGGRAEKFVCINYNYANFYRKMKRQLLIDLFAHFFLMYISQMNFKVKKGLIKKDKRYKVYFEKTNEDNLEGNSQNFELNATFQDIPDVSIKNIKIEGIDTIKALDDEEFARANFEKIMEEKLKEKEKKELEIKAATQLNINEEKAEQEKIDENNFALNKSFLNKRKRISKSKLLFGFGEEKFGLFDDESDKEPADKSVKDDEDIKEKSIIKEFTLNGETYE